MSPYALDILVPTRDRPARLAAMLGTLGAQERPSGISEVRLYLLDNGLTTAFVEMDVARQLDVLETRGVRTFYLRRPHLAGMFAIRRCLYETSSADVVLYLDDDVSLPPGALYGLWEGVIHHGFGLAGNLVLDVDGLHGEEIGFDHQVRQTLTSLADRVELEGLATVGDSWLEMTSPFGTNLMFCREVFDKAGAWDALKPFFTEQPDAWGEDVGVCVALKSAADAFIDISRIVLHFSPRERSFSGWETPRETLHGAAASLRRGPPFRRHQPPSSQH